MSYTKKQMNAFGNIFARCPAPKRAVHKADGLNVVTDGSVCVILDEQPDGFPTDDSGKFYVDFCNVELGGNHKLIDSPVKVEDLKAAIRAWKEERKHPKFSTPDQPRVEISGNGMTVPFDPRLLLDAMNAVGPKPMFYLGYRCAEYHRFPTLIVSPDLNRLPYAIVMPLRK